MESHAGVVTQSVCAEAMNMNFFFAVHLQRDFTGNEEHLFHDRMKATVGETSFLICPACVFTYPQKTVATRVQCVGGHNLRRSVTITMASPHALYAPAIFLPSNNCVFLSICHCSFTLNVSIRFQRERRVKHRLSSTFI